MGMYTLIEWKSEDERTRLRVLKDKMKCRTWRHFMLNVAKELERKFP